jgi:hypothetical protein
MKSRIIYIIAGLMLAGTWSCEEYLDKVETSDLTAYDVFGTYTHFQGFQDQMYDMMVPYNNFYNNTSYNYGDHVVANATGMPTYQFDVGNYWAWYTYSRSVFADEDEGIWAGGWRGIRIANLCLANIDTLKDATQEQRELLLGQAYFFRAYFHWEIIRAFGGLPYIDTVIQPADNMKMPRPSYQEANAKIVKDLDRAIDLLPADWDETETGGATAGANRGRATKGAALGIKAKALLYAASPLMNNESTGSGYVYNNELLEQAAAAAHELLKLADEGYYSLLPLNSDPDKENGYNNIFYTTEGEIVPFGSESVWQRVQEPNKNGYTGYKNQGIGRLFMGGRLGQVQNCEAPTQNLVDLFEMQATGLPIDDQASGYKEDSTIWEGRDPRFYKSILTDGTKWVKTFADDNPLAYLQLYNGGVDRNQQGSLTGYLVKKFWPYGVNAIDQEWGTFWYRTPVIRLAEVYLIYAEAVNEVYGPTTAPTFDGETGLTAEEAVNIVRARAEMPGVHSKFTGDKLKFRERIRNERSVELCFEGQRWHDLRRWHIGHLIENKELYALDFDSDHTSFFRAKIMDKVFDEKHYWLPLPVEQVLLYKEYNQNPGW